MFGYKHVILSLLFSILAFPAYSQKTGTLSNSFFEIDYSDSGIVALKHTNDQYDTNYIAAGQPLGGLIVRYRSIGDNGWNEISEAALSGDPTDSSINYELCSLLPTYAKNSSLTSSGNIKNLRALNDGTLPSSARRSQESYFAVSTSEGNVQWVQYTFPKEYIVDTSQVWFSQNDDSLKLPKSWRLLYLSGDQWKPVQPSSGFELKANDFSTVNYSPVCTNAMRIEFEAAPGDSVGIAEWRIGPERIVKPVEDLKVSQQFELTEGSLNWSITLENKTDTQIDIGDLAVPMRFAERTPRSRGNIYTHKLLRHSYVAGYGSWIFWHRSNAVGPYLVMTTDNSTKFEYFDSSGRAFTPYIHAKVASEPLIDKARDFGRQQPWRLPLTKADLSAKGESGSTVTYSFKFQFAPDFDGVRDVLYAENLFDINVLPGMALPIDLPAMISLRTKVDIANIEPEFVSDTKVEYIGQRGKDNYVYKVSFNKLGENMLKVCYGDDKWMSLEFFVMEPLETVIKKRSRFLVTHMQHNDPDKPWYGGYGDWDQVNKVLRNPEDRDRLRPWLVDSSDDAGNARPAYIAAKNVFFPDQAEIASVERYIRYYLWNDLKDGKGGMQMTENEKYPYGIYGTFDNWWGHRISKDPGRNGRAHLWRIYDYPHIIHMYYRMYQIACYYPDMVKYKNADEYLELAYRAAKAYWEVPKEVEGWSANSVGTMNEAFMPELIEALAREGKQQWSDTIRAYWESKVARFVLQTPNLFGSEFAFDSTGFESTQAFARYAVRNAGIHRVDPPTTNYGLGWQADAKFSDVTAKDAEKFQQFQMLLNVGDRGWLETTYYQLGSDYRNSTTYLLSYMSHLGGWAVLDHGLYFANNPTDYLRLGYASSLSAWSLVNSGNEKSGYGFWFPGKENDGATGGGFVPVAWGGTWIGKQMPRGAWYYSAEEEVGYVGALRTHATILTDDPIFGDYVYGGILKRNADSIEILSRDGLRSRFHVMRDDQRLHLILERDGFAADKPIIVDDKLSHISFTLENRSSDTHRSAIRLSGLPQGKYKIYVNQKSILAFDDADTEQIIEIPVSGDKYCKVEIIAINSD